MGNSSSNTNTNKNKNKEGNFNLSKYYANKSKKFANQAEKAKNNAIIQRNWTTIVKNEAKKDQLKVENARKHANMAQKGAIKAQRGANIAQRKAISSQTGANIAQRKAISSQRGAKKSLSDINNIEEDAETSLANTETSQAMAETSQSNAQTAETGAIEAQERANEIVSIMEKDLESGSLTFQAMNPVTRSVEINNRKNNLENLKSLSENATESFMNIFKLNNKNKEGFDIMDFLNAYVETEEQAIALDEKELQIETNDVKKDQGLEFGALRNDIMGKLLMDYMINEEGTNIEKVYDKLNQKNNDALRKIQISNYYTKSYKEYINLLKIILIAIAIIIPILIFNRLEIINKNISLLSISLIIFLTSLFCIYRIYLLYMKDPIDFDKIKIPYDRQMSELVEQEKISYKDSPFKSAGITCIGDECCDENMVYDNLRNKCINKRQETQESFHNYFENAMKINNSNKSIIQQNDIPESQKTFSYLGGNANIIKNNNNHIKEGLTNRRNLLQQLTSASLQNSTYDKF